jgi:exodeoxyribonuclease V alpha subunit
LGPLCGFAAVGDPVIVTRNRYDEALMNGLVGWVVSLDPLTIRFDGETEPRTVSDEASWELASAWAVTGHKAQGSEAPYVVVALDGQRLLTREWLYTAITRATRSVVLVGSRDALERAVRSPTQRLTGFKSEL